MYKDIRRKGARKTNSFQNTLGYSKEDLLNQLQATMPAGYSWEDVLAGRLHIDHVRPLASFSYQTTDDQAFRDAWALSNLQLLPAMENMRKGARLDWKPS